MQHDDQEHEDQHFQHGFDDDNFAPMDNDLHLVEQRKDHPHLTGMYAIYFAENVRTIQLASSTSMRPGWQFPAIRHATSTTNDGTTWRLEPFQ